MYGEGADTGKFYSEKRKKKRQQKPTQNKFDAILTYRQLSLIQKAFYETHNYGIGGGEESVTGGNETKQSRRVGEGGGKDMRRAVACAVAILCEEKGVLIGGIKVGR